MNSSRVWIPAAVIAVGVLLFFLRRPRRPRMYCPAFSVRLATRGGQGTPMALFAEETIHRWSVDTVTGMFRHAQTDFYLDDTPPIVVTRFHAGRSTEDAFGRAALSYDLSLSGDAMAFSYIDLSTPDALSVHFARTSPGTSYEDAVFRCATKRSESVYRNSVLAWNGNGWTLGLTNGEHLQFPAAHGDIRIGQGSAIAIEDPKGGKLFDRPRREGRRSEDHGTARSERAV